MNMYFVALVAPDDINRQVLKWKTWMNEKFGCQVALRSPAHITLIPPFWMKPESENNLVKHLQRFSEEITEFTIHLSGFSNFKPKVIFTDVEKNETLDSLKEKLFLFPSEEKFPFEKDDRPFHPHITIATRDLHKKSFYEAWDHFKEKQYTAEWIANGISLLRHNKKNWDVIHTSQFIQ